MRWDALSWAEIEARYTPALEKMFKGELSAAEQSDAAEALSEAIKRLDNTVKAHAASIRALSEPILKAAKSKT